MTPFQDLVDLASERLGGAVLLANDEFFAPKEALLKPGAAECSLSHEPPPGVVSPLVHEAAGTGPRSAGSRRLVSHNERAGPVIPGRLKLLE